MLDSLQRSLCIYSTNSSMFTNTQNKLLRAFGGESSMHTLSTRLVTGRPQLYWWPAQRTGISTVQGRHRIALPDLYIDDLLCAFHSRSAMIIWKMATSHHVMTAEIPRNGHCGWSSSMVPITRAPAIRALTRDYAITKTTATLYHACRRQSQRSLM